MTTVEFLSYLRSLNVKLRADGDRLRCSAPQGTLTPALKAELSKQKTEILTFLHEANRAACSAAPPLQPVSRNNHVDTT